MKTLIASLALFFFTFIINAQTTYTVDNRAESGAQYTSVQSAIDAAVAGDIIYIHPSPSSYGNITLNKSLKLIGLGHNPAKMDGLRASLNTINIVGVAGGSQISGLNFSNLSSSSSTDSDYIIISNNFITGSVGGDSTVGTTDNWIIKGNYFYENSTAIQYRYGCIDSSNSTNWNISNNYIYGILSSLGHTDVVTNNIFVWQSTYFPAFRYSTAPIIANNLFIYTGSVASIGLDNCSDMTFTNCLTYSYTGTTVPTLTGTGNLDNTDPQFVSIPTSVNDFYNNDYRLSATSAGKNYGTDGTDIGLFGFNFKFDTDGRPENLPFPESMVILNTIVQPGQSLNVEFKASTKQ